MLAAHADAGGVLRRAATLAGLPEATFRRRYEQATHAVLARVAPREPGWDEVRALLRELESALPAGRTGSTAWATSCCSWSSRMASAEQPAPLCHPRRHPADLPPPRRRPAARATRRR